MHALRPMAAAVPAVPTASPPAVARRAEDREQLPLAPATTMPAQAGTVAPAGLSLPWPAPASTGSQDATPRPQPVEFEDADAWAQQLVHAIVTLCERTDPAIEAWSVTLPMEPRMLPHTELHLSLSRHRIALRFQTLSPESLRLLSLHRASLPSWLRQSLSGDRDIDIEIA